MSNLTMLSSLFRRLMRSPSTRAVTANYGTAKTPNTEIYQDDDEPKVNVADYIIEDDEEKEKRVEYIAKVRNKSGLRPHDRRKVLNQNPYDEPQSWIHLTASYQRKMYARHGAASGVDPRVLFPTPDELADRAEYERVAFPKTLHEMVAEEKAAVEAKKAAIRLREERIAKNLGKLDQWTNELNARIAMKEAVARAAIEKRERLIEEVRREIGLNIDRKDPRFQELMEKKEMENKMLLKKKKKADAEKKRLAKLMSLADTTDELKRPEVATEQKKDVDATEENKDDSGVAKVSKKKKNPKK